MKIMRLVYATLLVVTVLLTSGCISMDALAQGIRQTDQHMRDRYGDDYAQKMSDAAQTPSRN